MSLFSLQATTNNACLLILTALFLVPLTLFSQSASDSIPSSERTGGAGPDSTLSVDSTRFRSILEQVTIKAKKALYEQKADRTIINVQSSPVSSGSSVLDVLRKSPGVVIDNQNNTIAMNGRTGAQVMINGKVVQLPLNVVLQMLGSMSSSNISKIELITTPPSKYSAEGVAGSINIITRADPEFGTSGTAVLTLGYKWKRTLGGAVSISHRDARLAYFVNYSYNDEENLHVLDFIRQTTFRGSMRTITDESTRPNKTITQNLAARMEWKATQRTTINAGLTGYRRNWVLDALSEDNDFPSADSMKITDVKIHELNIWEGVTLSLGLEKAIDSNHRFSLNAEGLYYRNNNPSSYDNQARHDESSSEVAKIDLTKKTPIKVLVATADYEFKYSPVLSFEAGIKGVISQLNNDVHVQNLVDNRWVIDSFFTSSSVVHEKVGAAYLSSRWSNGNKLEANIGLRYEFTHTNISSVLNRNYGYLFPTLLIKRTLNKQSDLALSYSRRITRPTYNDIAPYVFFWGPSTFSSGNTSLQPAVSDAVKTSLRVARWMFSAEYSHTKNEIVSWQPERDSITDNITFRAKNLRYLNTFSVSSSVSISLASWWKLQNSVTLLHQSARVEGVKGLSKVSLNGINASMSTSVSLPAEIYIDVAGTFRSKTLNGIANFLSAGSLNVAVQKKFRRAGTITFAVDDVLYTDLWRIKSQVPQANLNTYFHYDFHNQFARVTYAMNFGNNRLRSVKANAAAAEEKSRIAN